MGGRWYNREVCGRKFRPETLSAIILRKLKLDAEKKIGPFSRAVITVPAFFDDTRRKATEDAGRIAGIEVLDIINEPTAAALAYAMQSQREAGSTGRLLDIPGGEMTALVYDLGGGTFDVTVVRLAANRFETVATDGEVRLGGKDWDDKIVRYLSERFKDQFGTDPSEDPHRRNTLAALAEKTKKLLSKLKAAPVEFSHQGHTFTDTLAREQFEEITSDLMTRTRVVTELVVTNQAKLEWGDIDRVLLVGGSTRMPMVKSMLGAVTGQAPDDSIDADQVVAQGAAIHAGIVAAKAEDGELAIDDELREQLQDITELNVNSHSLGVQAHRRDKLINAILIEKNTQLPVAASKIFRLYRAGATAVRVKVLEGEAEEASSNIPIGECRISGLPPGLPKNSPIQVRLAYGANGRVSVMALDMTHGRFAQANIERNNRLTEEDLRRETEFVQSLDIQ
jgi:molecular chaperone DnaK